MEMMGELKQSIEDETTISLTELSEGQRRFQTFINIYLGDGGDFGAKRHVAKLKEDIDAYCIKCLEGVKRQSFRCDQACTKALA